MKSAYFNEAKAGKIAIALIVNGDITLDTDTIVGMVAGKPLYIRWNNKSPSRSIEVHYAKVAMNFGKPHSIIDVPNETVPMGELASAMVAVAALDGQEIAPTSTIQKKPRKAHVTNPVKKAIVSGDAHEFLDPELEKFLALLAECI